MDIFLHSLFVAFKWLGLFFEIIALINVLKMIQFLEQEEAEQEDKVKQSIRKLLVLIFGGVAMLILGDTGDFIITFCLA